VPSTQFCWELEPDEDEDDEEDEEDDEEDDGGFVSGPEDGWLGGVPTLPLQPPCLNVWQAVSQCPEGGRHLFWVQLRLLTSAPSL
jgi:hypothetical protein